MKKNKFKIALLALGLGFGINSASIAAWYPSPEQCAELEIQCEEDFNACRDYFHYCMNR